MKRTNIRNPGRNVRNCARFLGALLAFALLVPVVALSQSPARVNIGTAGDFVALAKTGISATGTTQITGDIGISPAAATYITGFGLIMDPSGTFSTSTMVAGKVYAASYASPTPAKMTTAIGDMETAYTDAAGRTTPNYTELYAGDLTGRTLTPGLYKWGTGVLVSAGGVTISGNASDVWIFQVAQNVTIANGAHVTLTGGAQASNIFWQVAGQVTLGTTSQMKGIILCQTAILMSTGASLDGRALSQTAVTLDGNSVSVVLPSDTTRPTVLSTDPANSATGVAKNKIIGVIFSEAMDSATINATTFTLKQGATPVPGTVSRNGANATFAPASFLVSNTVYTGTITTGARDLTGNALLNNYVWNFTTATASDSIRPTVSSTDPANNATGVAINKKIAATFSEAMDPATISTTTFLLKQGATPITGTVTYVGTTATFTPASALAINTTYTATITTGAKDLAGNALAAAYVWSFTTGAAPDITAPTVSSTDPANAATGVAINKKIAATFSEAMDPATIGTTTFLLNQGATPIAGTVTYAGTTATFTPTSALVINTTYTATITIGVKDLAGNALAVAYVWSFTTGAAPDITAPTVSSTDPANAATGVAINKKIAATFSEAMDPATISTTTFLLNQGATPIAGTVTYAGTTATFTPASALASNTTYSATITTGAKDLAGNALAAAYVWSFTTGAAADITAPTVSSTDPANAATGVAINKKIAATFSEAMDPATINTTTFLLNQGATPVTGTVTYAGTTATFTPASALASNTTYTATITTGVMDLAGNAMAAMYTWSFTTGTAADITAPTVSSTDPASAATGVAINKKIAATFSEAMDPATIGTTTFLLKQGATDVAGTVTYAGTTATFTPAVALDINTMYTAVITTGVRDLAGNAMARTYVWNFVTGAAPDITAPMVISTDPANSATGVAINKKIAASFSERMDPATIGTATFLLNKGTTPVAGTVTYAGTTATFAPASALDINTTYTATITTGVQDLAGNAMASPYRWSFTTGALPDNDAPTVISTDPANAATDVALDKTITATFSEAMDPLTINTATCILYQGTIPVAGTITYAGMTATFSPASALDPNTVYTGTITTGVTDLAGNPMLAPYTWSFATGAGADTTAPTVISTDPANAAILVVVTKSITATFSERMDPSSITTATFTLMQGTTPVAGTVTYAGTTATFTPASALTINTTYTATITTGVKDLAGNAMANIYTWSFSTAPTTDVQTPLSGGEGFNLSQNYPNPFNPSTSIQYRLENAVQVSLKIYNLLGDEVATLVDGPQEAGSYIVQFNSTEGARSLPSGVYSYRLEAGNFIASKMLILNK